MNFSKRKVLIISITILMMVLLSNIFGFSSSNFKPNYGITTENVNLRKQANLNSSSIVKTIPKNTNLKIVGDIDHFYIVQLPSNEVGLISKDYVTLSGTSLEGSKVYENYSKYYATVNGNYTNLRGGPATHFQSYKFLNEGTIVEVIGKIDDFLMVVTEDNSVGMIREDLVTYSNSNDSENSETENPSTDNIETSTDPVAEMLNLINNARKENGLSALTVNDLLQSTAQTKANDMVSHNYFSHTSPTYGSPFDMMKNAGVLYKTAGENIAGNPSIQDAFNSWMSSESHKENILSNAYNYVGIGVEKSDTYGYIIVVMFIGK
ncbi:MAG: CAP domain-containing protein [Clostridia bacterium]|nr:CAP domain-containing protein [Clostridia bacterium]